MNQEIKETILNTAVGLYCQGILFSLLRIAFLTVRVYFIILFDTRQAIPVFMYLFDYVLKAKILKKIS